MNTSSTPEWSTFSKTVFCRPRCPCRPTCDLVLSLAPVSLHTLSTLGRMSNWKCFQTDAQRVKPVEDATTWGDTDHCWPEETAAAALGQMNCHMCCCTSNTPFPHTQNTWNHVYFYSCFSVTQTWVSGYIFCPERKGCLSYVTHDWRLQVNRCCTLTEAI